MLFRTITEPHHFKKQLLLLKPLSGLHLQGVKKVPDPKQNYIGLMTEG